MIRHWPRRRQGMMRLAADRTRPTSPFKSFASGPNDTQNVPQDTNRRSGLKSASRRKRRGMKRDALDALFSLVIRTRDHFTCQRCQAVHATNSSAPRPTP